MLWRRGYSAALALFFGTGTPARTPTMASGKRSAIAPRQAVALRHVAYEDLGLLAQILRSEGWDASYRESASDDLAAPAIEAADLLIVLGGPFGAYETETYPFLAEEIAILERRPAPKRPTLRICP